MSNEKKEKVNMDPKYLLTLTATLFATCVVVAGALGFVNKITAPKIQEILKAKTEMAMRQVVLDENSEFSEPLALSEDMTTAALNAGGTLAEAYEVTVGGEKAGYTFKVVSSGSQGNIELMVGVDAEGAVTGVAKVKASETKGIGTKVTDENAVVKATGVPVLDQFKGKTAADMPLTVGSNVDAITGATVSTRGVTAGVNAALAVAQVMN